MKSDTGQNLKIRYRNVLQILCKEYEALPGNAPVPSVRSVKQRFGIGSAAAEEILHQLFQKYALAHTARKKVRKPVRSGVQTLPAASGETVLCTMSDMGYFWEPIVQEFNRLHRQRIFVRYLTYLSDFFAEMAHPACDFYLFPTNPVFLEIVRDSGLFIDLDIMMSGMDTKAYYPCVFLQDAGRKTWGIAPNLIMDVLCVRRDLYRLPYVDLQWDEFRDILRQVKRTCAGKIGHALVFPCYHSMMTHLGMRTIDPETLAFDASQGRYEEAYSYMQTILGEKLAPYVSDCINQEEEVSLFYRGGSAFHVFSHKRVPPNMAHEIDLCPLPVKRPEYRKIQSEVFAVSAGSMNYERAWSFIQFVLSKEIQHQMLDSLHVMPAMRGLCPPNMTPPQFRLFASALEQASRHCEDSLFTLRMQKFFDSSMDRCLKYGGDFARIMLETKGRYESYWNCEKTFSGFES